MFLHNKTVTSRLLGSLSYPADSDWKVLRKQAVLHLRVLSVEENLKNKERKVLIHMVHWHIVILCKAGGISLPKHFLISALELQGTNAKSHSPYSRKTKGHQAYFLLDRAMSSGLWHRCLGQLQDRVPRNHNCYIRPQLFTKCQITWTQIQYEKYYETVCQKPKQLKQTFGWA